MYTYIYYSMSIDTIRKDILRRLEKSKEVISDLIPKEGWGIKQSIPAVYQGMCTFISKRNCVACPQITIMQCGRKEKNERKGER